MKSFVKKALFSIIIIVALALSMNHSSIVNAAGNSGNPDNQDTANQAATGAMMFTSIPGQDGWILETNENSDVGGLVNKTSTFLYVGDDRNKRQYRSILSFKTSGLPDNATITKAILKIRQYSVIGNDPDPTTLFHGFVVDIVSGHFGTLSSLQVIDFQLPSNGTSWIRYPHKIKSTYSLDLKPIKSFVNTLALDGGLTQIRLGFEIDDNNSEDANILALFSGDAATASYRPQLLIGYSVP